MKKIIIVVVSVVLILVSLFLIDVNVSERQVTIEYTNESGKWRTITTKYFSMPLYHRIKNCFRIINIKLPYTSMVRKNDGCDLAVIENICSVCKIPNEDINDVDKYMSIQFYNPAYTVIFGGKNLNEKLIWYLILDIRGKLKSEKVIGMTVDHRLVNF